MGTSSFYKNTVASNLVTHIKVATETVTNMDEVYESVQVVVSQPIELGTLRLIFSNNCFKNIGCP